MPFLKGLVEILGNEGSDRGGWGRRARIAGPLPRLVEDRVSHDGLTRQVSHDGIARRSRTTVSHDGSKGQRLIGSRMTGPEKGVS